MPIVTRRLRRMSRSSIERQLTDVAEKLKRLRGELAVVDEQLVQLTEEADEARIRSLVSETPIAEREHHEAQRHLEVIRRHRQDLGRSLEDLEHVQDDLLDRLISLTR